MNSLFWQGKRVFLTGHTGFKGSWLSLWLQNLGARITGYSLDVPTHPSLFKSANVGNGMTSIIGDVRDGDALMKAISDAKPEIVIHMAAQALVRKSYAEPVETYSTNVMGTVNLLEAVRKCAGIRAVVNVTTDKCYENREWVWSYRENEPMGGYDPYSNSKGCAELVTGAYRNSFFNPSEIDRHGIGVATARAGNVIGGGDWAEDRLIPDVLKAFSQNRTLIIRSPSAIRPWQHVLEPLRGYLTLAELLYEDGKTFSDAFNFGPRADDTQDVEWVVKKVADLWDTAATWKIDAGAHPHEALHLKLDISKAEHYLRWHPRLCLDEAINLTVEWYKGFNDGKDVREITLSQIECYQNKS